MTTKNLYQVVDDLFSRLPLYAVDYTRVVEINEDVIGGVWNNCVSTKDGWSYEIALLKATREEAEREAEANLNKAKKQRLEEIKEDINKLLEEFKELTK